MRKDPNPARLSCCSNSFWGTEFVPHAPVVLAKRRLVVMQRVSGDTEGKRGAVLHVAGAHRTILPPLMRLQAQL
jgi:hypothetical protein